LIFSVIWSSSLCDVLHPSVTCSEIQIVTSVPCYHTPSHTLLLGRKINFRTHTKQQINYNFSYVPFCAVIWKWKFTHPTADNESLRCRKQSVWGLKVLSFVFR
jgi:hypothetical protein